MKDRVIEFEIDPYESAGVIRFGMSPKQVRALLFEHNRFSASQSESDSFVDLGIRVHYSPSDTVEAIEFQGPAFPTFMGRRLLERYSELESWFQTMDPASKLEHSGLTSLRYGIRLYAASARKQPDVLVEVVSVFDTSYAQNYIASVWPPPGP